MRKGEGKVASWLSGGGDRRPGNSINCAAVITNLRKMGSQSSHPIQSNPIHGWSQSKTSSAPLTCSGERIARAPSGECLSPYRLRRLAVASSDHPVMHAHLHAHQSRHSRKRRAWRLSDVRPITRPQKIQRQLPARCQLLGQYIGITLI